MKQVENALKLRNLSKTRWVYRNESIEAVSNSFKAIRKALTEVTEKDNNETTNFRCPLQCLGFRTKGKKPVVRRRTREKLSTLNDYHNCLTLAGVIIENTK